MFRATMEREGWGAREVLATGVILVLSLFSLPYFLTSSILLRGWLRSRGYVCV